MANVGGAFGLRPVRHKSGAPWNGATVPCYCEDSYAVGLFIGDPIMINVVTANKMVEGLHPTIILSAGTDGISARGVIVAFEPNPDNLSQQYRPASQERIAHVCMDPSVIYQIRDNGGGTPVKQWVGLNAVMVATSSGDTTTGLSGMELDASSPAADQSMTLFIEGVANIPGNDLGDDVVWEVSLNTMFDLAGTYLGTSISS